MKLKMRRPAGPCFRPAASDAHAPAPTPMMDPWSLARANTGSGCGLRGSRAEKATKGREGVGGLGSVGQHLLLEPRTTPTEEKVDLRTVGQRKAAGAPGPLT